MVPRCKKLIFFRNKRKEQRAGCVQVLIVCSGMGGLFRAAFREPAGPPFVLAALLHDNGLQEHDLDRFEAILEFFHLQLFNTAMRAPNPNQKWCF